MRVAAAQVGAVDFGADRKKTLARLLKLLEQAAAEKVELVLFPETTFTTFFPRHLLTPEQLDEYFEHGDDVTQSPKVKPFFDRAKELEIDVSIGFAERTSAGEQFNTCVYVSGGQIISKYRKVHLPGTVEPFANPDAVNQLEKRYFKPGDLGFKAFRAKGAVMGMLICNDRRWPEAWRVLGLQGVEIVLIGYNTVSAAPDLWGSRKVMTDEEAEQTALFHHKLVMQANSYMNSTWSISAARCGADDGKYGMIAGSTIINPEGEIVAESKTKGDELVVADIDLTECEQGKTKTFDFSRHRRIEHYGVISTQTGVIELPVETVTNGVH